MKIVANNKKAYASFEILDKFEAGIVLQGWEVKSIKESRINLKSSYIKEKKEEIFLLGSQVNPLRFAGEKTLAEVKRDRKLLLKRKEMAKIREAIKVPGLTVVPLMVYIKDNNLIKVEVGIAKGLKKFDKRAKLKERDIKRNIDMDRKKYGI